MRELKIADTKEESLDPQDWTELRALLHRAVDDSIEYLAKLRDQPCWQPIPDAIQKRFTGSIPRDGEGLAATYSDYQALVAPYAIGNAHPRFWGWVMGNGTPVGMLAALLEATTNCNAAGFQQAATFVEVQVLDWLKSIMGFPADASGVLVSGGSIANLTALNVARFARVPFEVRQEGTQGAPRLMVYASTETHNCVQKAVEIMGLGANSLAHVAVDAEYQIDVAALAARVAADKKAGKMPFCVVANAGTVNTGAIDPLDALADYCEREGLWLHVDGAFGAFAVLDPSSKNLLRGLERADSIAFDLHKWMYQPYDVGCVLIRSRDAHRAAFTLPTSYLTKLERGMAKAPIFFADYSPELSRSFRALKVWMNLKAYGLDKFARLIAQNIDQSRYLASEIERHPKLELLAPAPLNVVNFCYRAPHLERTTQNDLNSRILAEIQESGIGAPTSTVLNGRFAIRVANTNHRSRREDFDALVAATVKYGDELLVVRR